jgi:hypothetical protein
MNAFVEHHRANLTLVYSCFDRILLNLVQQALQQPARIARFFEAARPGRALTRNYFRELSAGYHRWVQAFAEQRAIPIVEPPKGVRREDWVEPFYHQAQAERHGIAVILKSHENAQVAVCHPTRGGPHLEVCPRWVWQYYFYLLDADFGRLFLRVCPYFPFNCRMCLNGHEWLACRLRAEGIAFRRDDNAFLDCADPARLQALADAFGPDHLQACARRWLAALVPFFQEEGHAPPSPGYGLFVSQAEYCTNLVFHQRASLDRLMERLLDANRALGRPDQLATIFGRRLTQRAAEGVRTRITDYHLGNPCLRSQYRSCALKEYVRSYRILRGEASTNFTPELGVRKAVAHLPELRDVLRGSVERYLEAQQDILETYVDRGQLQRLRAATVSPTGRRTPGIKLDDVRLLAVMQALTCFAYLNGLGTFRTGDVLPRVREALGPEEGPAYTPARLRYDLSKLRGKGLVQRVAGTQGYCLSPEGYRICVLFLKLFQRVYAPLTAAVLEPFPGDRLLPKQRIGYLDRLYRAVDQALGKLLDFVGVPKAG